MLYILKWVSFLGCLMDGRDREKMGYFCMKLMMLVLVSSNFKLFWALNDEGMVLLKFRESVVKDPFGALSSWSDDVVGETDHCYWFGVQCVDGLVVSLNLKNLCLKGTLAPELGNLLHIKSIILRNNSFCGSIPEDICHIEGLELLDLGFNNLTGPLPQGFRYNVTILHDDRSTHSVHQHPRILLGKGTTIFPKHRPPPTSAPLSPPAAQRHKHSPTTMVSPPSAPHSPPVAQRNKHSPTTMGPPPSAPHSPPPPMLPLSPKSDRKSDGKAIWIPLVAAGGGAFLGLLSVIGICLWRSKKVIHAAPCVTGLSGQLQKAFVTGIPKLKKTELETACEDFSNIIGFSSLGTIYKGMLSNGIEIAVISLPVTSAKEWSRNLERQFVKKIETLSKVNHKNFVNLIGYCDEKRPFTRMLVFEYAPSGCLFEHLHVKEAEHLDWGMRLRITMGMAYCLEYMHQLAPPIAHPSINSSSVNLSEDYAAKISDFCFWNEVATRQVQPLGLGSLSALSTSPESNVYSFGLVLLEMMTGQIPQSLQNNSLENWVSGYLRGDQPLQALVDPMLRIFNGEQLEKIDGVIRRCLHADLKQRPTIGEVTTKLKEITGIDKDKASPRLSPMWWAELETRSVNGY